MWTAIRDRLKGIGRSSKTVATATKPIPPGVQRAADQIAAELQVDPRLHPADFIFWSIANSHGEGADREISKEYFEGGRGVAQHIKNTLNEHGLFNVPRMLDFAGGYSRVARHFPVVMPDTHVTVCDIHDEALVFARQLGFDVHASSWRPESFRPGQYELVIAISFLTHMPRETWANWLGALGQAVTPGGVLLVTTHGVPALEPMGRPEIDPDGFGHLLQSEQHDLALTNYASTVTLPAFVQAAARDKNLDVVSFRQGGFGYQDLWLMTPKVGAPPETTDRS